MKNRIQAFTLMETVIVLGLVAILFTGAGLALQAFKRQNEVKQAQQVVVQELNQARSSARRLSVDQEVKWTGSDITVNGKAKKLSASGAVSLSLSVGSGNSFSYTAPYGRRNTADDLEFELKGRNGKTAKVRVYGITGKVVSIND